MMDRDGREECDGESIGEMLLEKLRRDGSLGIDGLTVVAKERRRRRRRRKRTKSCIFYFWKLDRSRVMTGHLN